MESTSASETREPQGPIVLPRITIRFCTMCKWMLRAAYFAQELLSTFSTAIGEVALIPSTGGIFTIDIVHSGSPSNPDAVAQEILVTTQTSRLWDREAQGGFPEVKHLKQLVRNIIDPTQDLGHVDGHRKDKRAQPASNDKPAETQKTSSSGASRGETTVPLDPDAAIARGPPDDDGDAKMEKGKGEVCEDCA
ncbi:hypothetical protein N7G274_000389 [Stereocaulon virgatum]|uniref:Rdx family-domain-containing protein n=1 Tax=Stereocaulon virgatum TaxID=373712 RepID=A0ABR4AS01_9LECA